MALDILNASFTTNVMNRVRVVFGILDAALLLSCFLGMFGVFEDTKESFAVSPDFLYFAGVEIEKRVVGIIIALNLAVPIMFYIGSPCQETVRALSSVKTGKREEANQG